MTILSLFFAELIHRSVNIDNIFINMTMPAMAAILTPQVLR